MSKLLKKNKLSEDNSYHISQIGASLPTDFYSQAEIDALILAQQDTLMLPHDRVADGCLYNSTGTGGLLQYPAADADCSCHFDAVFPKGWTAMVNPKLCIGYLSTANDTWQMTTRAHSAAAGESGSGNNLYNAADNWTTVGAAWLWHKKEITLTGTISPEDMIGVRLRKTSADAQILFIHPVVWLERV